MIGEIAPWLQHLGHGELLALARNPQASSPDLEALAMAFADEEEMVKALLANPSTPSSALVALARRTSKLAELLAQAPVIRQSREAAEVLMKNPNLSPERKRDLSAELARRTEKRSLFQIIKDLTTGQKIALAKKGNKEARMILIKDQNEMVQLEVVSSPRITEAEILAIAQMRDVSEKVLRSIANDRRYRSNKLIVLSLLHNPKTPVGVSLSLGLNSLTDKELEGLAKNRNIPGALSRAARNILEQRRKPPPEPGGH